MAGIADGAFIRLTVKKRPKTNDYTWLSQHKFLDNCKETEHVSRPARPANHISEMSQNPRSPSCQQALSTPMVCARSLNLAILHCTCLPKSKFRYLRTQYGPVSLFNGSKQRRSKPAVISCTLESALSRLSIIQLLPNFVQTSTQVNCKLFSIDS